MSSIWILAGWLAAAPVAERPPPPVEVVHKTWMDAATSRAVLVRIYVPQELEAKPLPVVVVSPAMGTNREGYDPVARRWAEARLVVVVVTHQSSNCSAVLSKVQTMTELRGKRPDREILERARGEIAADPSTLESRDRDLDYVLKRLERGARTDPALKGRLDMGAVGVLGHGLGATGALRRIGQGGVVDPRVKAVVVLSGRPADELAGLVKEPFSASAPVLLMTRGKGPEDDPFPGIEATKYRVEAGSGGGFAFSRVGECEDPTDFVLPDWGYELGIAFWRAFLSGDAGARDWLDAKRVAAECGDGCRVEVAGPDQSEE